MVFVRVLNSNELEHIVVYWKKNITEHDIYCAEFYSFEISTFVKVKGKRTRCISHRIETCMKYCTENYMESLNMKWKMWASQTKLDIIGLFNWTIDNDVPMKRT